MGLEICYKGEQPSLKETSKTALKSIIHSKTVLILPILSSRKLLCKLQDLLRNCKWEGRGFLWKRVTELTN